MRMFQGFSEEQLRLIQSDSITNNYHLYGIPPSTFSADGQLGGFWNVNSINQDRFGRDFVSAMEAKDYPIFAVQFHPEKPGYRWKSEFPAGVNRSWESISINNEFTELFVKMARANPHTYDDVVPNLIQNYDYFVTDSVYGDFYMFE